MLMNAPALDRHFALRKLHSLLGLIPIGAFLVFHLYENSQAAKGKEHFQEHVVGFIEGIHLVEVLEIFFIALPILFHGIYGVIIWFQGRTNTGSYGYFRNWMYLWQRIAGAVAFVFILTHVWETRMQVVLGKLPKDQLYDKMVEIFSNPVWQVWYAIGIVAAVFHFANGLWLMGITWGFTVGPRSQKIATGVWTIFGLMLLGLGFWSLFGFKPPVE
jgi:succinate dehydrogenase / fumarate reductase cytochrome b subunit